MLSINDIATRTQAQFIGQSLSAQSHDINVIDRLPGTTNRSYKIRHLNASYALRLPGPGTSQFIDRQNERDNSLLAFQKLALTPEPVMLDANSGIKIVCWVNHGKSLRVDNIEKYLDIIAPALRKLHRSQCNFTYKINLVQMLDDYLKLVPAGQLYQGLHRMIGLCRTFQSEISQLNLKSCPVHFDLVPENILVSRQGRIQFIDWEYSGQGTAEMDIASLFTESELDERQRQYLLDCYRQPLSIHAIAIFELQINTLWSIWSVIQKNNFAKGNLDYHEYGLNRLKKAEQVARQLLEKAYVFCQQMG